MTREQIETITPQDAGCYLAQRVMGWHVHQVDGADAWCDAAGEFQRWVNAWSPQEDLNQAFEAAEKVGLSIPDPDDQVAFRFSTWWSTSRRVGRWLAGWYNPDRATDTWRHVGSAPTPALAVCRAVIAAHEAKEAKP